MIEPENNGSEDAGSLDALTGLKYVGIVIGAMLLVLGLSWTDLLGSEEKRPTSKKGNSEGESKKNENEDVADYEEDYLEGEINANDYSKIPSK
tara:strand:+ start:1025 stop:1303 length:279 start_codon:yes stop_codon:yes gene_type:complete